MPTRIFTEAADYYPNVTDCFVHFSSEAAALLFDSGKPEQAQGRFDIFSAWPKNELVLHENNAQQRQINYQFSDNGSSILEKLSHNISLPEAKTLLQQHWASQEPNHETGDLPFTTGWMGFACYELGQRIEPQMQLDGSPLQQQLPLFWAGYYDWAYVQDHQQQRAWLIYEQSIDREKLAHIRQQLQQKAASASSFELSHTFSQQHDWPHYQQCFEQIQQYLAAGDCYQVNFAQRFQASFQGNSFNAYCQLRSAVPSPHMAYLHLNHKQQLLSISPERFLKANGQQVSSKPIKGTAARHSNTDADHKAATALQGSAKNRAENLMIVDLIRNDLSRHSKAGSVQVNDLFALESYRNVHHLVSDIHCQLKPQSDIWDVFFDSFPGGSITGAPKIRACQIIHELEDFKREIYCGSLFYASNHGQFDANIAIRTLLFNDNHIYAWAGGGIVYDSNAEDEYQECFNKIQALLNALH